MGGKKKLTNYTLRLSEFYFYFTDDGKRMGKKLLQVLLNWINYFLQERFKGNTLNYEQIKSY